MDTTRFITHIDGYDCGGCFSEQLVKITSLQFNEENDAGSVKLKMLGEVCQGRARLKAHDISRYFVIFKCLKSFLMKSILSIYDNSSIKHWSKSASFCPSIAFIR